MSSSETGGPGRAWSLLLAAAERRRRGTLPPAPGGLRPSADAARREMPGEALESTVAGDERAVLLRADDGTFVLGPALTAAERDFVELYLPLLGGGDGEPFVLAHLGQSADARIATLSGDSNTVTGRADFVHMHRLRALSDVVLVGAGTVAADDPRLTTRLVEGPNPVRVVLDPGARLGEEAGVFRDRAAPTLRVRAGPGERRGAAPPAGHHGTVTTVTVPMAGDGLSLPAVLGALRARNLPVVFIEGGGVTVTRWLVEGLLDRLHLVAAPVLVGDGRPALSLPGAASMAESLRPPCRLYRLGRDVLWDFDLRGEQVRDGASTTDIERLC